MKIIKNIVYDHLLDNVLTGPLEPLQIPDQIIPDNITITNNEILGFLNDNITPLRNRLPTLPISKVTLSKNPQAIIPVLRYLSNVYQELQEENEQQVQQQQQQQNFIRPRMFALFPTASFKWKFIKIDSENIKSFFQNSLQKEREETLINYTRRLFFHHFNFRKFRINDLAALINLPEQKGKMFLNSLYTDGYTCRVSFARRVETDNLDGVRLTLDDFNFDEVTDHFRVSSVDPGRRDAMNSYHGEDDYRRLTTKEYYHASGSPIRMKKEDIRKVEEGIKLIETNIPSAKTTSREQFLRHIQYLMLHMVALFEFYNFGVARINWNNFRGRQKALDNCANILIHGSTKYNRQRRKKKKSRLNRRKRKYITSRRNPGIEGLPIVPG